MNEFSATGRRLNRKVARGHDLQEERHLPPLADHHAPCTMALLHSSSGAHSADCGSSRSRTETRNHRVIGTESIDRRNVFSTVARDRDPPIREFFQKAEVISRRQPTT